MPYKRPKKKTVDDFKKQADSIVRRIAEGRDQLQELINDYTGILGTADRFMDQINNALTTLDELL